jgi:hypothetical protein
MRKRISRRDFLNRAGAAGLSAPALPAFLAGGPSASYAANTFKYTSPGTPVPELALAHYGPDAVQCMERRRAL